LAKIKLMVVVGQVLCQMLVFTADKRRSGLFDVIVTYI